MLSRLALLTAALAFSLAAAAQQAPGSVPGLMPPANGYHLVSPVTDPTLTPGMLQLLELESKFAADVAQGGGKAFASWFAPDAVTLSNGKPAVLGRGAIAAQATWDPKDYSLTWTAQGAQMGPSNDMGYTWGHYVGKFKGADGKPVENAGRYITIWKKLADGTWKVVLDASSDDAPEPGTCCTLPKP